ncbi:MAG TPA: hypothetical protein VFN20_12475 [Candidatus Acidoferrum sp.]|nr:hypothetical protein [Candidatus Acidoferrum sp.]
MRIKAPSPWKAGPLVSSPRPIDDVVENTGLNSSGVLATLFDLEMKGFVRQLSGKLFSMVLFQRGRALSRVYGVSG